MINIIRSILDSFLRCIHPPFCTICQTFDITKYDLICHTCDKQIKPIVTVKIPVTLKYQVTIFAVSHYQYPLNQLILAKTYNNIAACSIMGELLWTKTPLNKIDFDFIVPVPLHWTRYAQRGYNQTEEIAYIISKHSGRPIKNIITRTKKTKFQLLLNKDARNQNVAQAFVIKKRSDGLALKDKTILIIDDLLTTGATLKEVARALAPFRPKAIIGAVICRT